MKRTPLQRKKPLLRYTQLQTNPPLVILSRAKPRKKRKWIRYDALDQLFGKYIRLRDGKCQYCGRSDRRLEAAHMFGRGKHSTRFDPENVYAMCGGPHESVCHRWLDLHTTEKLAWLRKRLGDARFEALELKSNRPAKIERAAVKEWLLTAIAALETWNGTP